MDALEYFLQANCYLLLFYAFYLLLLERETFFNLNRIYLVGSAVLSFLIPVLHAEWVNALFAAPGVESGKRMLHTVLIEPIVTTTAINTPAHQSISVAGILTITYYLVAICLTLRLIWRLFNITFSASKLKDTAYSFFKRIVVSDKLVNYKTIYRHEATHARQFHSVDVILFELLAIIVWFNPVIYGYKKSLKHIHEFIADEAACQEETKVDYALLLLSNTLGVQPNQLVNSFFNRSLLKKRILMLHKAKSNRTALIKYGLTVPLFAVMLVFSSAKMETGAKEIIQQANIAEPIVALLHPAINTHLPEKSEPVKKPTKPNKHISDTIINFASVEVKPEFPGGDDAFIKYLNNAIKYPAREQQNNIRGRVVMVSFIVEKDGRLSDIKVLRDIGGGYGEEAVRALKMSPKWLPGTEKGKIVRVSYISPITFNPPPEVPKTSDSNTFIVVYPTIRVASQLLNKSNIPNSQPQFPAGEKNLNPYLEKSLKYPKKTRNAGTVRAEFIVQKDGALTDIKVTSEASPDFSQEVLRVLKEMPKWESVQNGREAKYACWIKFEYK